jgi:hypothetical protein
VFGQIQKTSGCNVDWSQITWIQCQEAMSEMSYMAERSDNARHTVWARYFEEMDKPENFRLWPQLERKIKRELRERQADARLLASLDSGKWR